MFEIALDKAQNAIEVTFSGFFDEAEAEDYVSRIRSVFVRNNMRAGYTMLIDCSACSIQQQGVLGIFQKHMASFPKARRIAMVTGSSLVKMQVKRIMTQSYMRMFVRRPDALAWILEDDAKVTGRVPRRGVAEE